MKEQSAEELAEIIKIAERIYAAKISDAMKDSLFNYYLKGIVGSKKGPGETKGDDASQFSFNPTMKKFIRTYGLSEERLAKLFHLEEGAVDFLISDLKAKSNAEGIRRCILLVGLKNAIENGKYHVAINQVRDLASTFAVYDAANFSATVKRHENLLKSYQAGKDSELSGLGIKAASELAAEMVVE
jgi:hypothetical protein